MAFSALSVRGFNVTVSGKIDVHPITGFDLLFDRRQGIGQIDERSLPVDQRLDLRRWYARQPDEVIGKNEHIPIRKPQRRQELVGRNSHHHAVGRPLPRNRRSGFGLTTRLLAGGWAKTEVMKRERMKN
jgi:hypothetical protein